MSTKFKFIGIAVLVFIAMILLVPSNTEAQEPLEFYSVEPVVTGIHRPIDFVEIPDDSNRFLIVEQRGIIQLMVDGELQPTPFLNLQDRVYFPDGYTEQGLLGLALDPNFVENGRFYVNYTSKNPRGMTKVSRFELSPDNPNAGDPSSESIIITVAQPYANHNGGMLDFGPDGYLYISFGDGGSADDPQGHGQNLRTLLGTIARVDVTSASPYLIPDDNPFVEGTQALPEIWAYGLRNVWRFSFDIQTGDLYLADVGQNEYEEVNFQPTDSPGGENYGWNVFEADEVFRAPAIDNTVMPVASYSHSQGCSISGGYVYRGESLPELDGYYLYGDFCNGQVWWLVRDDDGNWHSDILFDTDMEISGFGQDTDGEVYILDHRGGIYKIVAG